MILDSFDAACAVRTIWGEARGEGDAGMKAVAHVLFNRLKDGRWGQTLGSVCLAPYQFSCWNIGDPNRRLMLSLGSGSTELEPASAAFNAARSERGDGIDPSEGATHYKVVGTAAAWAAGLTPCASIGRHEFFTGVT
jgi:N-acetylmuramoyl-L-alanine amidase